MGVDQGRRPALHPSKGKTKRLLVLPLKLAAILLALNGCATDIPVASPNTSWEGDPSLAEPITVTITCTGAENQTELRVRTAGFHTTVDVSEHTKLQIELPGENLYGLSTSAEFVTSATDCDDSSGSLLIDLQDGQEIDVTALRCGDLILSEFLQ